MKINRNTIYILGFYLLISCSFTSCGQGKESKVSLIVEKLKLVETQKFDIIDYKLKPLKYQTEGKDSARIIEIENLLTDKEISKRISIAFVNSFSNEEIDLIYNFMQTSAFEKLFNSATYYESIAAQFEDINKELEEIKRNIETSIVEVQKTTNKFEPIAVNRETGFYELIDYIPFPENKDIKLEEKPSITTSDILEVKKAYSNYGNKRAEIEIQLTKDGARKFYFLTKENIGNPIAIVIEKYIVSMPIVNSEIIGGRVSISGDFLEEEIDKMIEKLKE